MTQAALSLLWTLLALLPSPHLQESLKALLLLLLHGHGKARPQHSQVKSPSALSRFLNRYPWPTRALIRLARKEAEKALDRARKKKGPKPRLLVVLDLVTLEKRGRFQGPAPFLFSTASGDSIWWSSTSSTETSASPWAYRLWRGKGEKALSRLALSLLASLPPWMRRAFRIRVAADAAFGTTWFLFGVKRLGFEAVVGMRRDRRLRGGGRLGDLRRQGSRVYLWGLSFPVWVAWYRYPLPQGGWEWRYVVATFPATPRTALTWGKRRFAIEHFFRAAKSEFSLGQFGQRTALGVHRFLVLSLLAYLLAHWVGMEGEGSWREARERAARVLLPELVVQVALRELYALGLWPPGGGGEGLCGICGRCKF
ncbi:transposase IS4 family protein [Marinithermus hydrothermalis DSM 14884]|uniref:Transposase IS4 family protein n=1 Tax=Marinithermus hydrothermalis (strain DSM 14884 / JCM 11576 / T1) TaxID=869210 RepID=F2NN28_MARHT|nr:transposase IS4 family protein [Marinithermus hydrothermalis DSM 14884]